MKIVMMKKKKDPPKKDMFAVLSLVQSVTAVIIILTLFAFTKVNSQAISDIQNNLRVIFSEDMDIGGYFTPSEEKTTEEETTVEETAAAAEEITVSEKTEILEMDVSVSTEDAAVMPVMGTVTSDYGYREHPVYSGESFHSGRDIAADEGSPVYCVLDGVVTEAGEAEMAGKYVKILHSDGTETLYCHCSKLETKEGTEVKKGDVIALVGQTGLATGPHLHFEYHRNGKAEDPGIILEGAVNVR